jgi:tripartite ATP-independent transporter DctM subunit
MDPFVASGLVLVALLAILASGIWVAITLVLVGFGIVALLTPAPAGSLLATTVWDNSWNWALTALPLFIWMGELLFRTRLSEDMFRGLAPWLGWLPGRLLHVNVVGCGVMAAVAGSSSVTCATIGRISLPELKSRGYDERMAIGTLAGSGTLGLLIPPSIMLIVYGIVAQQSISRLFIAGVLPGLLLIVLFMSTIVVWAWLNPGKTPPPDPHLSLAEKLNRSRRLIPVLLLIAGVLGSIYGGVATPTEAATIGVIGALVLAAWTRTLSLAVFVDSLLAATRTTCMICFIIAGASFLSVAMGFTGIPNAIGAWVEGLDLSNAMLLVALTCIYIILGCFLEGTSMIVLTSAVVLPMVAHAGFDPIWFGIYLVVVVEMAQITPPVGFNLFILQGMTGRDIWQVTLAALPFFFVMIIGIVILAIFPEIATVLPSLMIQR